MWSHCSSSPGACFQAQSSWLQGIWFLVINQLIIHTVFLPQAQLKWVIQIWLQEKRKHLCSECTEWNTDKQFLVKHWILMVLFFFSRHKLSLKNTHRKNQNKKTKNKSQTKICLMPYKQKAFCPDKKSYQDLVVFVSLVLQHFKVFA